MGSVLATGAPPERAPNCLGVYELHHPHSGRCILGLARDLAHTKFHHLKKLAAGLHENQTLQAAYNESPVMDFVFYPVPTRQLAEQLLAEIKAELQLTGRLFEETQHYPLLKPPSPDQYNA